MENKFELKTVGDINGFDAIPSYINRANAEIERLRANQLPEWIPIKGNEDVALEPGYYQVAKQYGDGSWVFGMRLISQAEFAKYLDAYFHWLFHWLPEFYRPVTIDPPVVTPEPPQLAVGQVWCQDNMTDFTIVEITPVSVCMQMGMHLSVCARNHADELIRTGKWKLKENN